MARKLVPDGKSISAIARTFDAHSATIYRAIDGYRPYATFLFLSAAQAPIGETERARRGGPPVLIGCLR